MLGFSKLKYGVGAVLVARLLCGSGVAQTPPPLSLTARGGLSFGSWSGSGAKESTADLCVYNSSDGSYNIRAENSIGSAFRMTLGGDELAYYVDFRNSTSGSFTALTHGQSQFFSSGADTASETCSGSSNASVRVRILEADLGGARPGLYSATLVLTLLAGA